MTDSTEGREPASRPGAPDRRTLICETAVDLAAVGGNRAITHRAIDRARNLPKGSTSYYFRTRRALLDAAVAQLTERSSISFHTAEHAPEHSASDPAGVIAAYLHGLITHRSRDVRARMALAPDAAHDDRLAESLGACLFSRPRAVALFQQARSADPETAADDLLVFCEGVAASHVLSRRTPPTAVLAASLRRRFGEFAPPRAHER